jgi:hypothetical protein
MAAKNPRGISDPLMPRYQAPHPRLFINLRQRRTAQTVSTAPKIDQDEFGRRNPRKAVE